MRTTRATAAVERLNTRMGSRQYSMVKTPDDRFMLVRREPGKPMEKIGEPQEMDVFVEFVNRQGPQVARRVTKNDAAFEKQLTRKTGSETGDTGNDSDTGID